MVEKLTSKQEAQIPIIRQKWLDLFFSGKEIDKDVAKKEIEWMYKFCGKKKPIIMFFDSPMALQIVANLLKDKKLANIWTNIWANIGDNIWANIWANIRDNIGDNKLKFFIFSYYGNVWDYSWVAYCDYFLTQKLIKLEPKLEENFNHFKQLLESGVYDMIQFDGLCLVSSLPIKVRQDSLNRLHSDEFPSTEFRDGYKTYNLHGVRFTEELWKKVVGRKMSFKEVAVIKDIDQRTQAMAFYPDILKNNGKLLDKSERGNELWLISKLFRIPAYFLFYKDPSTDREYMSGVDPKVGETKNADSCMAWKHNWSLQEYNKLKIET